MDLNLLSTSVSGDNTQRSGARFTVRSANSPSYSLSRGSGVRRPERAEDVEEKFSDMSSSNGDFNVKNSLYANQNGTADGQTSENGTDGEEKLEIEGRGRTDCRKVNKPIGCDGFHWRSSTRSPVRGTKIDTSTNEKFFKRVECSEDRTNVEDNMLGRVTFNSEALSFARDWRSVSLKGQNLDRAGRYKSLPSRLRFGSEPGSRFTESPHASEGTQSIQDRIKKLFESTSVMPKVGTFPRLASSGDNDSPVKHRASLFWPQSDAPVPPEARNLSEKSQEQFINTFCEEVNLGTKSLDRARSRNTLAAQIRCARTAEKITKPNSISSSELKERSASIMKDRSLDLTARLKVLQKDKETDEGGKRQAGLQLVAADDVFETNSIKSSLNTTEKHTCPGMLAVASSEGVRNKIKQFEALTQRANGQVQIPRRTFSVPAQLCKFNNGVKKSSSAKNISERDKCETQKKTKEKERENKSELKTSFFLDGIGLRLGKMENNERGLFVGDKSGFSGDFGKYSRFKKTLSLSLDIEAETPSGMSNLDEMDFSEHPKSEVSFKNDAMFGAPLQVGGGDETPTNIPNNSPFILAATETDSTAPVAPTKTNKLSLIGQEPQTKHPDSSQFCSTPLTDNNTLNVVKATEDKTKLDESSPVRSTFTTNNNSYNKPDVKPTLPKGRKQLSDLTAWIAGLEPEYQTFNSYMVGYEDDDQSTQKDDDSNYDSDSGESSVTITSNRSASDRKSFGLSLSDLCNFSGSDYEMENDDEDWQLPGRRSASLSSDVSAFSCVSLLPAKEIDKLVQDVKSLGEETLQNYNDVKVVVLHKEVGVGLGFSLAGGVDQNKPVTVHKVFPSGIAAQEGTIREGDHVLSINGTALGDSAHWEALRVLRRAKTKDMAVVVLKTADLTGALDPDVQERNEREKRTQCETGQRVCVQLEKSSRDLGFSLLGGPDSSEGNRPLTVQRVFHGGPVDLVFPGDEIVEIQGTSMVGMRRLEVWTFIRNLPSGPVEVVLCRPLKHLLT